MLLRRRRRCLGRDAGLRILGLGLEEVVDLRSADGLIRYPSCISDVILCENRTGSMDYVTTLGKVYRARAKEIEEEKNRVHNVKSHKVTSRKVYWSKSK